jgi:SOS-response transcriptional repressor LexA
LPPSIKKPLRGGSDPIADKSHSYVAERTTSGDNRIIYPHFQIYQVKNQIFLFFADNVNMTGSDFVKRIDTELNRQNKKRPELAKFLNISAQSFVDWRKRGNLPSADIALKIAKFLKVSVEYLITGKDEAGLTPEQQDLLQNYDKLDKRDKKTVLDLIETMLKRPKEEKTVYTDAQLVSFETKEIEPTYPQPLKVQKRPKIDGNAAIVPIYYIPFYGKVAAGRPIDINISPDRVIPAPGPVLKGDKSRYFSIEIKGTSMTKAGIRDGDYVIMRRAEEPENGKVMLVRYGNESTVKRVKVEGEKVFLCWEDGSGEIIEVDSSEYEIQGEFVKLLRDLD